MTERFCKKCNHLCHCIEADHNTCKCENCECETLNKDQEHATDLSFENNGELVIDSTDDCESCQ